MAELTHELFDVWDLCCYDSVFMFCTENQSLEAFALV